MAYLVFELHTSATQAVGTAYFPSSDGVSTSAALGVNLGDLLSGGSIDQISAELICAAGVASATVDIDLEWSNDRVNWLKSDSYTQVTSSASVQIKKPALIGKYVRVKSVVGTATSSAWNFKLGVPAPAGAYNA